MPICFFWCGESISDVDNAVKQAKTQLNTVVIDCTCLEMQYELKITPLIESAGLTGMICFARDITERMRLQTESELLRIQLLQSQKMEAIGQLAGGMAHDFNNMLTVIMGNAALAINRTDGENEYALEFMEIMKASEKAKALTMKLLTFARKEKFETRSVRASKIIEELAAMLDRSYSKKIKLDIGVKDDSLVSVDENQIIQALVNICNNSRDAMPEGGILTIECHCEELDDFHCEKYTDVKPGRYCLIQISDNGAGMPKEMIDRAFEPFFTTKAAGKGTGLGLSITFGIVKGHNGILHIYSEQGHGTTVKIFLPLSMDEDGHAVEEQPVVVQQGKETIMILDDEKAVLDITKRILQNAGYRVIPISSGEKALDIYREQHKVIDVVIIDMIMPEMDGLDVFRALKKINPAVKVLLSSGFTVNGQASKIMKEGVNRFLQKPYNTVNLCNTIRDILNE